MAFVEETTVYFSDFGIDAIVGGVASRGIFDEVYGEVFGIVSGASPSILLPSGISATEGTAVTIGARSFIVTGAEPDGTGFQRLRLETV